jgi:hypothetical protein
MVSEDLKKQRKGNNIALLIAILIISAMIISLLIIT